jgi:hypothetical protein
MTRRPFTLLSAVSLLLCVATCVLWIRSYWVGEAAWNIASNWRPAACEQREGVPAIPPEASRYIGLWRSCGIRVAE